MLLLIMMINLCFGNEYIEEINREEILIKSSPAKKMAASITVFIVAANLLIYSPIIYANLKQNE